MIKVQLISSSQGVLELTPDPEGLNDFKLQLKRSEENDGVFYEFSVNLKFNKASRNYFSSVYESEGIQGVVTINLYEYNPNNYDWPILYSGKAKLKNYTITQDYVQTNLEQIGFQRKFLNLVKRDVDINASLSLNGVNLPDNSTEITLPSKTIRKQALLNGPSDWIESGFVQGFPDVIRIGGLKNSSDFENTFLGRDIWVTTQDIPSKDNNYVLKVDSGDAGDYLIDFSELLFDLFIEVTNLFPGSGDSANLTSWDIRLMYQKNNETPVQIWGRDLAPGPPQGNGSPNELGDFQFVQFTNGNSRQRFSIFGINTDIQTINTSLVEEDEIYIWFDSDIDFVGAGDSEKNVAYRLTNIGSEFRITGDTTFPETQCKGFLVYEFLERIAQYITDQEVAFYSEFFGRTDLGYDEDGQGSLLFMTNGSQIRGLDKTIFGSWDKDYKSLESMFCLGWGFEILEDGIQVVRVEPKSFFYDSSINALTLGKVSNLSKTVSEDRYYQTIEVGYPEVEDINQVNGIDEFNTLRRFGSPITETDNELRIVSEIRASGFEIEWLRRLLGSTEESKLDDKSFAIGLIRDGGGGFRVELGSDYGSVSGVFDPDTAYNLKIRPRKMIENWVEVLSAITIRNQDKTLRFTYGEYNYELVVDGVAENDNLELSDELALWINDEYEFKSGLTREQREQVRGLFYGTCTAQDWDGNEFKGFFLKLDNRVESKEADFLLLRVNE